uniref:Cadherin domain-containing protein n=1 Tax=Ciona savignyi TaxID=51511 RepID=H2ZM01_CIOSA
MFSIEAIDNLGVLKVKKRLDYETAPDHKYSVRVRARNTHPDPNLAYLGSMDDVTDVVITVTDVNEPPEFTEVNYEFSVREDAIRGFPIRAVVRRGMRVCFPANLVSEQPRNDGTQENSALMSATCRP